MMERLCFHRYQKSSHNTQEQLTFFASRICAYTGYWRILGLTLTLTKIEQKGEDSITGFSPLYVWCVWWTWYTTVSILSMHISMHFWGQLLQLYSSGQSALTWTSSGILSKIHWWSYARYLFSFCYSHHWLSFCFKVPSQDPKTSMALGFLTTASYSLRQIQTSQISCYYLTTRTPGTHSSS